MRAENMPLASAEDIAVWLTEHLASSRQLARNTLDRTERFSRYGLDSLGAARLVAELSTHLGRPLSPTLVWEYPTIAALASHLTSEKKAVLAEPRGRAAKEDAQEPIAIVGMAARLPGAADVPAFWGLLRGGRGAFSDVPDGRWNEQVLAEPGVASQERAKVRRAAFLDRIDEFDPLFFGISPREAAAMDPQQRLLLELSLEALEDAGIRPSSLGGSDTAVLMGSIWSDYVQLTQQTGLGNVGPYTVTGTHHSILANRISYILGLQGPSFAIDSACSSGLVVAHLAADSLRSGESTLAIVGAVNLNVLAESAIGVSRFGALSQDGNCYTFDARANGYVRGEGGGILILKRLSRAIADGNPIYCVLRGSAVNNDGASNGLTAPNPRAQEAVLQTAYQRAGVEPSQVQYVEAHGTGTPLGDPIEARALGAVLGAAHAADAPLLVGSAKTNVGHLEGAAGTVGLIKVALAIKHRLLPPSRNFESPNPHADLVALHLAVPTRLQPWPAPERRLLAGVSSFGLGGTNGHVVVEEWPAPPAELVVLEGASAEDLRRRVMALRAALDGGDALAPLGEIAARALSGGRSAAHGITVVARSHHELSASLDRWLAGEPGPSVHTRGGAVDTSRGPVFVFPGQGAQWHGMVLPLLHAEPVFRSTIERCDRAIRRELGWSLIDELTASRAASRLHDIEVSLPAIIAIDIAVSAWWRSMGIEPAAVVGHSTGEIAAAHVAGALDLDDTMTVICAYGRLITRLSDRGAMALVGLPWDQAAAVLEGFEGRVFRAISDSAEATVLAGEPAAIDALVAAVSQNGTFCRRVAMNVSPHCPLVDELRAELFESLRGIRPRPGTIPLISEVTGAEVPGASLDAAHWVKNFGDPAFFSRAVDELIGRGHRLFIDVGPHPITKHSVETNLRHAGVTGQVLSSLRRDEDERTTLLDSLAALASLGLPVRWTELYPDAAAAAPQDARGSTTPFLLPLSAKSAEALSAQARSFGELLSGDTSPRLRDVVYTAAARRDHHRHRLAVIGSSPAELSVALQKLGEGESPEGTARGEVAIAGRPRVVFVMSGQGSQWVGMGRGLLRSEPVFRDTLESIETILQRHVSWSLLKELAQPEESSRLADTEIAQPALFAIQVGLARLLGSLGVVPDAVIGHSIGEAAAAHLSGALSLEDAVGLVVERGRAMQRATGTGKMAWAALPFEEAAKLVAGLEPAVTIGAVNDPGSVVLSGDTDALDAAVADLQRRGVACRPLRVNYAFHSSQMETCAAELAGKLGQLAPIDGALPMYSTVTGSLVAGRSLSADYWRRNVRDAVQFAPAVAAALRDGHRLFVEIGPHPALLANIEQCLAAQNEDALALFTLKRQADEGLAIRSTIARLFTRGVDPDWAALLPGGGRVVSLPAYPWQRQRYWIESPRPWKSGPAMGEPGGPFPLSGRKLELPDGRALYSLSVGPGVQPYLADHRVYGRIVVPAAFWLGVLLAMGAGRWPDRAIELTDVQFARALAFDEEARFTTAYLQWSPDGEHERFSLSTRDPDGAWVVHVTGRAGPHADVAAQGAAVESLAHHRAVLRAATPPGVLFDRLSGLDVQWGERWQWLSALEVGSGSALGKLLAPAEAMWTEAPVPPGLLDNCVGLLLAAEEGGSRTSAATTRLPFAVERVLWSGEEAQPAWGLGALRASNGSPEIVTGDLRLWDGAGRRVVLVEGFALRAAPQDRLFGKKASQSTYRVDWTAAPVPGARPVLGSAAVVGRGALADSASSALAALGARVALFATVTEYLDSLGAAAPPALTVWARTSRDVDIPARALAVATALLEDLKVWCASEESESTRLVVLTENAACTGDFHERPEPAGAVAWGLCRTARNEHPDLAFGLLDVDGSAAAQGLLGVALVAADEPEAALRHGVRFVPRLSQADPAGAAPLMVPEDGAYCLELLQRGRVDALDFTRTTSATSALGPEQVRVGVRAAGLNFRDVVNALGMYPGDAGPVGLEAAGVVLEVGAEVKRLVPGDRVTGLVPQAFGPISTASQSHLCRIGDSLSFARAATAPVAFLTAHRGLIELGQLRPGEKVLIHTAAGGVGLAAIQLARRCGAEIFATASPSKWDLLRAQGIAEDHLASSRNADFRDDFLRVTGGSGVDVVLNSLAGELVDASLALLPRGGRFLEMGKTDLRQPGDLERRHPGVRYMPFDILDMAPEALAAALDDLSGMLADGSVSALPHRVLDLRRAREAFRAMAQGQHTGKLVLVPPTPLDRDGTVLVTGGTGGLGALVAKHLVEHLGVRHLLLLSRAGAAAPGAAALQAELEALGARTAAIVACDVGDRAALAAALGAIVVEHPLTAIIHTAGALRDGVLATADAAQLAEVFRSKVNGAWNLHSLTEKLPLSAFVLFSSVAGVMGNAGQGAYAAANTWLDVFAAHRQSLGLTAISLSWGAWGEAGMVSRLSEAERSRIDRQGIRSLTSADALAQLDLALRAGDSLRVIADLDLRAFAVRAASEPIPVLLRGLVHAVARPAAASGQSAGLREQLREIPEGERERRIIDLVRAEVGRVLGLGNAAAVPPDQPLRELGLDSLTAVDLRTRLNTLAGTKLRATVVFDHPTANALGRMLLLQLGDEPGAGVPVAAPARPALDLKKVIAALRVATAGELRAAGLESPLAALVERLADRIEEPEPTVAALSVADMSELFSVIDQELETLR